MAQVEKLLHFDLIMLSMEEYTRHSTQVTLQHHHTSDPHRHTCQYFPLDPVMPPAYRKSQATAPRIAHLSHPKSSAFLGGHSQLICRGFFLPLLLKNELKTAAAFFMGSVSLLRAPSKILYTTHSLSLLGTEEGQHPSATARSTLWHSRCNATYGNVRSNDSRHNAK